MKLGRMAAASVTVGAALFLGAPTADAANGSNYVHLLNGLDYFFTTGGQAPPLGTLNGIWRCFPSEILHAPTRVINPNDTIAFNEYGPKICAVDIGVLSSPGSNFSFPTVALTSSTGTCQFLTTAGNLNYGLFSVGGGFGTIVGGPLNGAGVALLAGFQAPNITNPATAFGQAFVVGFDLSNAFAGLSSIAAPEGESVVFWVQDKQDEVVGSGQRQYWLGSNDEKNLCSSYSYEVASGTTAFAFIPAFEWGIGFATRDASFSTFTAANGTDLGVANTHYSGLATPFDGGSGSRTLSISNGEILGFYTYDDLNPFGGSGRLVIANLQSLTVDGSSDCFYAPNPNRIVLPTGGPGGPVLTNAIPQRPRIVGKLDVVSNALLTNPLWIAATKHNTAPGAIDGPYFPGFASDTSGATGNTGGFAFPVPPAPALIGIELYFSNVALNGAGTALSPSSDNGHSNANGWNMRFFP